jgi:2-polyprenyl-3-methyl-5-hydroxy-6-metoxy-1,4-benzoquinol methylase
MGHCFICGSNGLKENKGAGPHPLWECLKCGLLFNGPMEQEAGLARIYETYYDPWHLDTCYREVSAMKKRTFAGYFNAISGHTNISAGRLLDIGCATGDLMEEAKARGFDVYGVEISPRGIAETQKKFGIDKIIARPIRKGDFPGDFFDIITLCDVLEHIPDPLDFLEILCGILKPSGAVMIITPDAGSWIRKAMGKNWPHYKTEHLYYYNRSNIRKLLAKKFDDLAVLTAKKTLTIDYLIGVAAAYSRSRILTMMLSLLKRLPRYLRQRCFQAYIGEMLVICRKKTITGYGG